MLIAVSKIILVADRTFPVFVKAMVNACSVDGAAADGDVFRRNTGQLLCVQVVIDKIGIVFHICLRMPEGFHRTVQDLNINFRFISTAMPSNARNIVAVCPHRAAFCDHIAIFNAYFQLPIAIGGDSGANCRAASQTCNSHLAVRNVDQAFAGKAAAHCTADSCTIGTPGNIDGAVLNVNAAEGTACAAADGIAIVDIRAVQTDVAVPDHDLIHRRSISLAADHIPCHNGAVCDFQSFQLLLRTLVAAHINAMGVDRRITNNNAPAVVGADAAFLRQLYLRIFNKDRTVFARADPVGARTRVGIR